MVHQIRISTGISNKGTINATWGLPQLRSNVQSKGELSMTSSINRGGVAEKLQQLEPGEVDRILGVRLLMNGSMKLNISTE